MDPNANLEEQRRIVQRMLYGDEHNPPLEEDAVRLAELVEALDGWLDKGGFLPDAWKTAKIPH